MTQKPVYLNPERWNVFIKIRLQNEHTRSTKKQGHAGWIHFLTIIHFEVTSAKSISGGT